MEHGKKLKTKSLQLTAILSGILVSLACLFLTMSFAVALGLWNFQMEDLALVGWPFWITAFFAWIASTSIGSMVAVLGSQARERTSVLMHAFVSWAGAFMLFGGMVVNISDLFFVVSLPVEVKTLMWAAFFADALSLVGSLVCSVWVTQPKSVRAPAKEKLTEPFVPPTFAPLGPYP